MGLSNDIEAGKVPPSPITDSDHIRCRIMRVYTIYGNILCTSLLIWIFMQMMLIPPDVLDTTGIIRAFEFIIFTSTWLLPLLPWADQDFCNGFSYNLAVRSHDVSADHVKKFYIHARAHSVVITIAIIIALVTIALGGIILSITAGTFAREDAIVGAIIAGCFCLMQLLTWVIWQPEIDPESAFYHA